MIVIEKNPWTSIQEEDLMKSTFFKNDLEIKISELVRLEAAKTYCPNCRLEES